MSGRRETFISAPRNQCSLATRVGEVERMYKLQNGVYPEQQTRPCLTDLALSAARRVLEVEAALIEARGVIDGLAEQVAALQVQLALRTDAPLAGHPPVSNACLDPVPAHLVL